MNPLNIVGLISNIIDTLAETTPARLRRRRLWHIRRMHYWERRTRKDIPIKRRKRAQDKWANHRAMAQTYEHEAAEMEAREDD